MALNPNIILSGQQFDLMGAMNSGMAAAQNQNALTRQRQIEDLYRTQGNALMQGDTNALGQLAQFDPMAAQDMLANKQQMDFSAETMAMRREAARAAAEAELAAKAATLTAEQLAAEREALSGALQGGAFFYQNKDKAGYEAFLRSKGIDPAAYPFEAFPAHAADVEGVLDALDKFAPAVPEMTSSQKDYTFYADQETAAGRQPLSFNEWDLQARKAGAANVTVGNGPAPADVATFNKGVKSANVNEVIGDIRNTMAGAMLPTTGMIGAGLANVGGTAAGDVKSNVETLKAAASFSSLQAMRDASKTGAALGAVSDTEIRLLSAELANLEQSQSEEQFLRNLDRFERVYNEIVNGPQVAGPDDGTGIGTIEDGFRYIGGDSSTPDAWEPVQ